MKTKQLIQYLQELDPEGEAEVGVGNLPITSLEALPAFYDGHSVQLAYEEGTDRSDEINYWTNLIGIKDVTAGKKIKIHYEDPENLILEFPELTYEYPQYYNVPEILNIRKWREQGMLFRESYSDGLSDKLEVIEKKYADLIALFKSKFGYTKYDRQYYHRPDNPEEIADQLIKERYE